MVHHKATQTMVAHSFAIVKPLLSDSFEYSENNISALTIDVSTNNYSPYTDAARP